MKSFNHLRIFLILISITLAPLNSAQRPNIIFFLIDDWAWNGTPIPMNDQMPNSKMPLLHMPHLEQLAKEGMKFKNAYAGAPQCAPSRVCIQTGQSSSRSGYTVFLGNTKDDYYDTRKTYQKLPLVPNISDGSLDQDATTIPETLKPLGYTSAHIGKWHMGSDPGSEGYVAHDGDTNNNPGNTVGKVKRLPEDLEDPKLMFSITNRSIAFIEEQVLKKSPFYLQISHYAMHEGRECKNSTRLKYTQHPAVQDYYKKVNKSAEEISRKEDPAVWLGMGEDLDTSIGMVLEKVKTLGIEDNTYIVVTSDNGYRHKFYPNLKQPLHGAKWWVWQGGLRVPMVVKGPGIKANSDFKHNVINYDFLPTFYEWAGGNPKELKNIDGLSLSPYLKGEDVPTDFINRDLFFHFPHYRSSVPHSAIISGSTKVIHFYESPNIPMMFNLETDQGEVYNVATQNPEKHKALFERMMKYFHQVGARFPKRNPEFDLAYYQKQKDYDKKQAWGAFQGKRDLEEDEK